jgi:hypothetical protein
MILAITTLIIWIGVVFLLYKDKVI